MRIVLIAIVFSGIVSVAALGQAPPPESLSADLGRYYFPSPEAEVAARVNLDASLKALGKSKGQIHTGPDLLHALAAYDEVLKVYHHHEGYLHLRCALNRKDEACDADETLSSEVNAQSAFLVPEVLAITDERLQAFKLAEPDLRQYEFALQDFRRDAAHILPGPQQALLDNFDPEIESWQNDLYTQVQAGIPFGAVQTPSGSLDVVRQQGLLASSPDARIREEAFKRRFNGFATQRDLFAFALTHTAKAQNSLAKAHQYSDAPDQKYDSLYLDPAQTRNLLGRMAESGDIGKRFERIIAADYQRSFNKPMQAWDSLAPHPGLVLPIARLADAPQVFHNAFAGLGAEYQQAFDALLIPENRRADVFPGGARERNKGGFSVGFAGSTSILFIGNYGGKFKDLSVIAHEGGHAAHRSLMSANGVNPIYSQGPNFLFESFAAFNELILADYMAAHSTDPSLRRFYLEQWMRIKGLDAFYGAQDALLEQEIYEGVSGDTLRGADDLDKLTTQVDAQFSIFPSTTPELHNRWMTVSLMYEDPLYDVNYVYGGLLALKYYQLYSTNKAQFAPRYTALLKNGFNASPADLLKRFLNIDLFAPTLLTDDLELLSKRLNRLEVAP